MNKALFLYSRKGVPQANSDPDFGHDYSRLYPDLAAVPVIREDFLTQLEPGNTVCHARSFQFPAGALFGLWERPLAVGGTVLNPGFCGVLLPATWEGDYLMNGHVMGDDELFASHGTEGFVSRGKNRFIYALVLDQERLTHTLAALRGIGQESVLLPSGPLKLPPGLKSELVRRFHFVLHSTQPNGGSNTRKEALMELLYQSLLEIYMTGSVELDRSNASWRRASRTVRRVIEGFADCQGDVPLANLCSAANVSSSTLYAAFNQVTGMPPLQYFRARGINDVHLRLANAEYKWGAVSEIASRAGFTELGRFSAEYRRVFGVTPSVTLAQRQR